MFGKNEVAGPRPAADGFLVKSIFYTIQGEGPWAGRPTIFLRLAKCNLRCHFCLPPNTTIVMANGYTKNIVDIVKGDEVMSYKDGKFIPARVKKRMESDPVSTLVAVKNRATNLYATENHPILTTTRGWVPAGELTKADKLVPYTHRSHMRWAPKGSYNYNGLNMFGQRGITGVRARHVREIPNLTFGEDEIAVYNLSVAETNNYIANGIVVHNCDTDFEDGEVYGINELAEELARLSGVHRCDHFVITGGEPMLQAIPRLMLHKSLIHKYFQVETAGTVWPLGMEDAMMHKHITIVCSPKTAKVHKMIARHAAAWKYIIGSDNVSEEDGLPVFSTQLPGVQNRIFRPWDASNEREESQAPIYVQPCDEQDDFKNHANAVAAANSAMKFGYRLSIQMHKVVGLD